jgi:carbon-monoxide dehydrogenase medium subunit
VATVLEALEATVRLQSLEGVRTVPLADFILGPYTTLREPEELLTEITVPLRGDRAATYAKYQTMERPTVGVAGAITSEGRVRLVIGAAGPTPAIYEFGDLAEVDPSEVASQVEVIPDITGSDEYKRHIVGLYVRRMCESLGGQM